MASKKAAATGAGGGQAAQSGLVLAVGARDADAVQALLQMGATQEQLVLATIAAAETGATELLKLLLVRFAGCCELARLRACVRTDRAHSVLHCTSAARCATHAGTATALHCTARVQRLCMWRAHWRHAEAGARWKQAACSSCQQLQPPPLFRVAAAPRTLAPTQMGAARAATAPYGRPSLGASTVGEYSW